MKFTLSKFRDIYEGLQALKQTELPGTTSFKVARNLNKGESEVKVFDRTVGEIQLKYVERTADGEINKDEAGNIFIDQTKVDEYRKEIVDLLNSEIEIDFRKFTEAELSGIPAIKPEIIQALSEIIEFTE